MYDAAIWERLEAQIADLPDDRALSFADDCDAGRVRIRVEDDEPGFDAFVLTDSRGEVARVRVKA